MVSVPVAQVRALRLHKAGRLAEAEALYRGILDVVPEEPDALHFLGVLRAGAGQVDDALGLLGRAIAARPDAALFRVNRAKILRSLGRAGEAVHDLKRAAALEPDAAPIAAEFSVVLDALGQRAGAVDQLRQAVRLDPHDANRRRTLAQWLAERAEELFERKRLAQSDATLREAMALGPDDATVLASLAVVLNRQGRYAELLPYAVRALSLDPASRPALSVLGNALRWHGRVAGAVAALRRVCALRPDDTAFGRDLLNVRLYDPTWSADERLHDNRRFGERHTRSLAPLPGPFANAREPERRLRIGYLSSDFVMHPVARNLAPLLEAHDRRAVEVFLYAAHTVRPDPMTARMRRTADTWRDVRNCDDGAIARAVRADAVDILVIVAGHFDANRLLVAAHRAAPIHVSLHDAVTSGLPAMDYFITDHVLAPRHGPERFTERLIRLPDLYLHPPIDRAPPPNPPPLLTAGGPTFGCFGSPAKINDEVLALWAAVLHRVPRSRLRLKFHDAYADPVLQGRIRGTFQALGVVPERIDFLHGVRALTSHLALYHGIDVVLDTFPFCGWTSTFEALWMGVPVVTLTDRFMTGRCSASILHVLGLDALAAPTAEAWVEAAATLASDGAGLAALRESLRGRIAASSMCDGRLKARHVERAYRAMWRRWCRTGARLQ
jgi:predicted O-linked N-acetylglucosamine transferase (SPINDLY family)